MTYQSFVKPVLALASAPAPAPAPKSAPVLAPKPAPAQLPVPPETVITFPDPSLQAIIRAYLAIPPGKEITAGKLARLARLYTDDRNIADLTGIQHCSNLTYLQLRSNKISDISPLANLTNLSTLVLAGNQTSDISPLVANGGLGEGDKVRLKNNNLDLSEGSEDLESIRRLEERGVTVHY